MQKKITGLDERMLSLLGDDSEKQDMPTRRSILRMLGNVKADTADDARRTSRIIGQIRNLKVTELVLESDDLNYMLKRFEANPMGLVAWMQGQVLELIESAEKVETVKG